MSCFIALSTDLWKVLISHRATLAKKIVLPDISSLFCLLTTRILAINLHFIREGLRVMAVSMDIRQFLQKFCYPCVPLCTLNAINWTWISYVLILIVVFVSFPGPGGYGARKCKTLMHGQAGSWKWPPSKPSSESFSISASRHQALEGCDMHLYTLEFTSTFHGAYHNSPRLTCYAWRAYSFPAQNNARLWCWRFPLVLDVLIFSRRNCFCDLHHFFLAPCGEGIQYSPEFLLFHCSLSDTFGPPFFQGTYLVKEWILFLSSRRISLG